MASAAISAEEAKAQGAHAPAKQKNTAATAEFQALLAMFAPLRHHPSLEAKGKSSVALNG
jgi:hypothetical protein